MQSPYTGKEMSFVFEKRTWCFRGEEFDYMHASWFCVDSGESFTTDETDDAAFIQVTNKYRAKYGIPYTDEIISLRKYYGVSATKMSHILGFGVNQWRLYENGEVPSISNGRMIRSIMNPVVFLDLVNSSKEFMSTKEYTKLVDRIKVIIECNDETEIRHYENNRLYMCERGIDNGFGIKSILRLKNLLLYILESCGETFCTKMNKLLFYIDFVAFKQIGMSITGLSYRALDYGPVPERWDRIYSQFDEIVQEPRISGEKEGMVLLGLDSADKSLFTSNELKIIDMVCSHFLQSSSNEISLISHREPAWIDFHKNKERIPYEYAFQLKEI